MTTISSDVLAAMVLRLVIALSIGAAIGLERGYHGRPAGFRTHALVCLASAALMLVTVFQEHWFKPPTSAPIVADPTRIAQGVMTGIGFLGAGVIMKDGLSVRGLTTAASIWITSGIGILVGIGFYIPAALTALFALGALSAFRWIEAHIRSEVYAEFMVRFEADSALGQADLVRLVAQHGFSVANVTHRYRRSIMEYRMTIRTLDPSALERLSSTLRQLPHVAEFRLAPSSH